MALPKGYRLLTNADQGKKFGVDLEPIIYFDTATEFGSTGLAGNNSPAITFVEGSCSLYTNGNPGDAVPAITSIYWGSGVIDPGNVVTRIYENDHFILSSFTIPGQLTIKDFGPTPNWPSIDAQTRDVINGPKLPGNKWLYVKDMTKPLRDTLVDIANAIREKDGTTTLMTSQEMAARIKALPTTVTVNSAEELTDPKYQDCPEGTVAIITGEVQ